jgi:hypothetical protein
VDVVWLDFMAPHRHLVVVVTVLSARTNTNVPRIGARLPFHGSIALGAQHGKLDADLRTSALLGTPSVESIHDYYPFATEDGGRLAPMAAELVTRMDILVAVRRFPCMGAAKCRSLLSGSYVRMQHFVRRTTFVPFRRFLGMYGENSCNVFLLLFMVLLVPISATLCRRAVLTLWHAFLLLGLMFFLFSSFCLVASTAFSCKIFSFCLQVGGIFGNTYNILLYPRARFAKYVSLLTNWPKDHHRPGLGED